MSETHCPEDGKALAGVALERANGTVHKCPDCHGVWVDRELIERLSQTLESGAPPSAVGLPASLRGRVPEPPEAFRPCAVCGAMMGWRECGGVVVDVCREHGVWFDLDELEPFVAWVQAGKPRSGTHHEALPLASYLGLAAPPVLAQGVAGADGGWGVLDVAGGIFELLVFVAEILAD